MAHSFLLEPGNWNFSGFWLERNQKSVTIEGTMTIKWKRENWFTIVAQLVPNNDSTREITYKYRGHLAYEEQHYTYVLQHSLLGNLEGEGRLGKNSIIQGYWSVSPNQNQRGFESYYQLNSHTYGFTSSILKGHSLKSSMEATLNRQS